MIRDIKVQAKADYIASLSHASPLAAIEELVWNALDADAREVKIDLIQNALGAVEAIRISDDGAGVDVDRIDSTFGGLGGSWKKGRAMTVALKRRLHGRHGRGRFKAFALGGHVEWRTTRAAVASGGTGSSQLSSYVISGDLETPGLFKIEETDPGFATGTEVYITNVRPTADSLTDAGTVVPALAAKFALYLKAYPNVHVYFSGIPVTPVIVRKAVTDYNLRLPSGAEAKLEVIEWRRRFVGSGKLVFCGKDGFALHEQPAGVRPGSAYSFTAYVVSPRFAELNAENMLVMDELNPETRAYLEAARKTLRDHFRVRAAEADESRVEEWIRDGSYPFAKDDESEGRKRFDAAVQDMREHLDGFDSYSAEERRYLFGLLAKLQEKA
ncbi:MAG: ATP-binding protein [Kiritimatiellae bacterium]|nr:ATP-binding protein [Kiritimatiellia bacterium]